MRERMRNGECELEYQLLEAGHLLIDPPSSPYDLLTQLHQVRNLLGKVEQSPSKSMLTALSPIIEALVEEELLLQSENEDVRVAVASCISQITSITAPNAPYDDNLMKEVFQLIVSSFQNLSDNSSQSYTERISILETVANVRSCLIMLDIECDSLIVDMFRHFLNEIRDHHPENVFSSMEIIMTLVLEESEEIELELLSPILGCLEKDNQNVQPIARRLAENVIGKCAANVKPCLLEAKSLMDLFFVDYSPIVTEICKETNHLGNNNHTLTGEQLDRETRASSLDTSTNMGDGKSSWSGGEGTSRPPIVSTMTSNPLIDSPDQRARQAALIFDVEKKILQCKHIYICNLWKFLTLKLSKCRLEDFGLFEEVAETFLKAMEEVKVDVSFLRKMVFDFFAKAHEYDQQCSLFLDMSFMESQKNVFKEKIEQLEVILSDESHYKTNVADFKQRLAVIATQMKSLNTEKNEVETFLANNEEKVIFQAQAVIASLYSDLTKLEDQCKQLDKIESNLEKLSKFLQNGLEELVNLKPFPFVFPTL